MSASDDHRRAPSARSRLFDRSGCCRIGVTAVVVGLMAATAPAGSNPSAAAGRPDYRPALTPSRLLDTRIGIGAPASRLAANDTLVLQVTGPGAVDSTADAVALNVTVTSPLAEGFLTVWPCGAPRPGTSNLNFRADQTVPNLVISRLGTGGSVCISSSSPTHVVADLSGWYGAQAAYVPLVPVRILETRAAAGQVGFSGDKPHAGQVVELAVIGAGSPAVPDGAEAVVLNVTGVDASAAGYITVWECGSPRPSTSNLNLDAAETRPNLVIAKVGEQRKVCIFTERGAHLAVDLFGWFASGAGLTSASSTRILDTRSGSGQVGYRGAKPAAGATIRLKAAGVSPSSAPSNVPVVLLNVTGVEATAAGFVTVWPCGQPMPTASNLNLDAGATAANLVIARVGVDDEVCIFTEAGTHLIADIAGWFSY